MKGFRVLIDFARDRSAAIAPMYAIALFGLIMIAGVGWDYSRMATMDSELQNAADQAALAAATQLTGVSGARAAAQSAASTYLATAGSAWANETKLANDGSGRTVGGLTFEFFQSWNHATDVPGPAATSDANARYVRVTVAPRVARYALTAIGGVLASGGIRGTAVATLEQAVCNVPPLMVCAPTNSAGFPTAADIGIGLDLREMPQNSSEFTPGIFDLLDINYVGITTNEQNLSLGLNSDLLGCTSERLQTAPGRRSTQDKALNSRFGIYEGPVRESDCDDSNPSDFCPAEVTRNDLVRRVRVNLNQLPPATSLTVSGESAACAANPGGDLIPFSEVPVVSPNPPTPKQGFPLDTCQIDGSTRCSSFGDGIWDAQAYMNAVHGGLSIDVVPDIDVPNVVEPNRKTRYEVYEWERANSARTLQKELARVPANGNNGDLYCSAPRPIRGTPVPPSNTQKDRRVVTVAVVDCAGQGGRFDVNTFKFVDMFLLGPITENGGAKQLRTEIMGPARRADGGSGFQNFGRKKAVLVQ